MIFGLKKLNFKCFLICRGEGKTDTSVNMRTPPKVVMKSAEDWRSGLYMMPLIEMTWQRAVRIVLLSIVNAALLCELVFILDYKPLTGRM